MLTKAQDKERNIQQINEYFDNVREQLIEIIQQNDVELFIEDIKKENYDSMDKSRISIEGSVMEIKISDDSIFYSINRIQTLL